MVLRKKLGLQNLSSMYLGTCLKFQEERFMPLAVRKAFQSLKGNIMNHLYLTPFLVFGSALQILFYAFSSFNAELDMLFVFESSAPFLSTEMLCIMISIKG